MVDFETDNQLSGSLPSTWNTMYSMSSIAISTNRFTGSLPLSWTTMTSLCEFKINYNYMDPNSLNNSWIAELGIDYLWEPQLKLQDPSRSPTLAPTSSEPTFSPEFTFDNRNCVHLFPVCDDTMPFPEPGPLDLTKEESCCGFGGGKILLAGSIDEDRVQNLASDLDFEDDFTYSFWIHVKPTDDIKQIVVLHYTINDEEILINFIMISCDLLRRVHLHFESKTSIQFAIAGPRAVNM